MSDDESSIASSVGFDDLTNPDIITKYRMAGDFANAAIQAVVDACKPGAKVLDLCKLGDEKILEQTAKVYNKPIIAKGEKTKVEKGVAFPCCVSFNNQLGNFCPRTLDKEVLIKEGDVVKIELGVHLDGYIACGTHTFSVGKKLEGRKADAAAAAQQGLEAALRLLKPGNKSSEIVSVINKIGEAYGVKAVEGVKCCNVKRFVLEGSKQIPIRPRAEEKVDNFEIEENEVYALEIAYSTSSEGKCSDKDGIVTVFKRAVDVTYMLKLKSARQVFTEINRLAPSVAFSLRNLEDKLGATAKLGMRELMEHDLLTPFPVLVDRPNETIATQKCTALVLPSGVIKLTGLPYAEAETDKKITDEEVVALLQSGLKRNKKKKKKADK